MPAISKLWGGVLIVFLVSTAAGGALGFVTDRQEPGVIVTLTVETYDQNGRLVSRLEKQSDSFTENMALIWKMLLTHSDSTTISVSAVDVDGTSRTIRKGPDTGSAFNEASYSPKDLGVWIAVGTGTQPFGPGNYSLGNEIARVQASKASLATGSSKYTISLSSVFSFDGSYSVSEVGLIIGMCDSSYYQRYFLLLRDLLPTPQPVSAGQTMVVTYKVSVGW